MNLNTKPSLLVLLLDMHRLVKKKLSLHKITMIVRSIGLRSKEAKILRTLHLLQGFYTYLILGKR